MSLFSDFDTWEFPYYGGESSNYYSFPYSEDQGDYYKFNSLIREISRMRKQMDRLFDTTLHHLEMRPMSTGGGRKDKKHKRFGKKDKKFGQKEGQYREGGEKGGDLEGQKKGKGKFKVHPHPHQESEKFISPKVTIKEHPEDNKIVVRAKIKGLKKEDLKVEFQDGVLTICGEKQLEEKFCCDEEKEREKEKEWAGDRQGDLGGEKRFEDKPFYGKEKEKQPFHIEGCTVGKFHRSITLPKDVDVNNIRATWSEGVLELTIPRIAPPSFTQK